VWVLTPARSRIVGSWTLAWLTCWFALRLLLSESFRWAGFGGRGSTSSQDLGHRPRIVRLEVFRIPYTCGAQRWRLTSESGQWLGWETMRYGPSSGANGDSWVGDGGDSLPTQTRTTLTWE